MKREFTILLAIVLIPPAGIALLIVSREIATDQKRTMRKMNDIQMRQFLISSNQTILEKFSQAKT